MSRVIRFLSSVAVLSAAVLLCGCPTGGESTPTGSPDETHADDHGDAGHDHDSAEIQEALAQLSDEDRAAAEKQRVCPVSDEPLGSMGKPRKVTVTPSDGQPRDVFLCCAGCESAIKGDPDKFLAKLDE